MNLNPQKKTQRAAILLGVNIDHAATLRQARYREISAEFAAMAEPDPVALALLCEQAGADGITAHLREDRRHIQDADVWKLRGQIRTRLNLEMAFTQEMVEIALKLKPDSVCIVPENRREVTTEGGFDARKHARRLPEALARFKEAGIAASLFIDPDEAQVEAAARAGAPFVELHTGAYANAYREGGRSRELKRLCAAAVAAHKAGIRVNAGHGVNYSNVLEVREIPHLNELNIGHSILSRALFTGIERAVSEMKALLGARSF